MTKEVNAIVDEAIFEILVEKLVNYRYSYEVTKMLMDFLSDYQKPVDIRILLENVEFYNTDEEEDCENLNYEYDLDIRNHSEEDLARAEEEYFGKFLIGGNIILFVYTGEIEA